MANISVISKESHQVLENVNSSQVGLNENSVVVVQVSKDDVASITRDNNNALINLRNGEVIVIENYFNPSFADNSLVFQDESGQLYWVKFTNEDGSIAETILYYPIEEVEPLLYSDDFIGGILPWLIGAGAAGAIAAVADNGSDSNPTPNPQPKPNALLNAPIVIDDVPEHIGEVADGGVTNDARPEIKGSGAQPGAIIKIYNGDELIGETVALSNGDWSFTPDQDLKDGIYELSVTQTVSGQESDKSPIKTITLDTVPPSDITIDEIGNKGETNSETPKLSGEGEPESNVEIEIKDKDGNVVDKDTVPVDKDGKWEYTPEKNLDEGKFEVIVTPIDKSGNKGEEEKQEFNVDLTPPDIDIDPIPTDPEPEGWDTATNQSTFAIATIANTLSESENNPVTTTKNQTPTFTGTTKDSESVKVVIRDSSGKIIAEGPATVTNGKWQFKSPVTLAEGDYKLEATAYDAAGNSKVATSSFTVDITPPKVTIEELPLTNIDAPTFKGKTEDGATQVRVEIKDAAGKVVQSAVVNVAADGSWTYKPSKALPDGTYSVEASARDAVGNVSQPAKTAVEVDTIDPEITIDPLEDTSDTTPEINGKTEPGATVKVEILDKDGNPVATGDATVDPEGNWTFTPTEELPEGEYTVKAEAKDKAGNVGEATSNGSFKVDTTAPSDTDVTIDPIADTNDTTPEITGTTEPGTTVNVVVKDKDGKVVAEGPATVTGDTWTYTPSVELADGEYEVVAKATDKAGNTGESQPESFEVDTVAPELTIDELKPTN
ncbi:Ig-like domain-containing protein, partial [Acinetobacter sp. DSM 11652]|uniref:Ig-like domain-containing protein n=1 Tax=Acinetobacter sp. DSM 11652 TaxID=346222 RepID=UPI0008C537C8